MPCSTVVATPGETVGGLLLSQSLPPPIGTRIQSPSSFWRLVPPRNNTLDLVFGGHTEVQLQRHNTKSHMRGSCHGLHALQYDTRHLGRPSTRCARAGRGGRTYGSISCTAFLHMRRVIEVIGFPLVQEVVECTKRSVHRRQIHIVVSS
jgi:hypothetical protein